MCGLAQKAQSAVTVTSAIATCDNASCLCMMLLMQLTHLAIWGSIVTWFVFLAGYAHVWPTVDLAPEMVGMVCFVCFL